jgi:hypothetical protein
MSASLNSGTYGQQPTFAGALRQLVTSVFGHPAAADAARFPDGIRVRVREANDVRQLARSLESHSPGFAADLYAAASRHEGLND